jgi:nitrite reductase (cytochrome c-552)
LRCRDQWRLDIVSAENSRGFHAPHETYRVLAEAIDFARQGQLEVTKAAGQRAENRKPANPRGGE